MTQKILFLRNGSAYSTYEAALAALNGLSHVKGQPAIATYTDANDGDALKLIFAIGTDAGKCYIVSKEEEIAALNDSLGGLLDTLEAHIAKVANGTLGHVKNGGDLTFNASGEGTINDSAVTTAKINNSAVTTAKINDSAVTTAKIANNAVTYNKLQNTSNSGAGVVLGSTAVEGSVTELGPNEILTILSSATGWDADYKNKNNFKTINVGGETIVADSTEASFGVVAGTDNVTVAKDGSNIKISVSSDMKVSGAEHADVADEAGKLSTAQNIKVTGDTYITGGQASFDGTAEANVNVSLEYDKLSKAILANSALTGTPTAPTAAAGTNTTQVATTAFVEAAVKANIADLASALVYRGTVGSSDALGKITNPKVGDVYVASAAFGSSAASTPFNAEPGDMIICNSIDPTVDWVVIQANIDGAVTGPASAVKDNLAVYNSATGKVIADSGIAKADVVLKARKVEAGEGLTGGGDLSADRTISHAEKAAGTVNNGTGFTTSITVDKFGHVIESSKEKVKVEDADAVDTKTATFVSGISQTADGLGIVVTKQEVLFPAETGKVKINSGDTADYLENQIVSGTRTLENTYAVNVVSDLGQLKLDVTIDTIDGGTY